MTTNSLPDSPTRARIVGSTGLTALVRCVCGYKSFFHRVAWLVFEIVACNNCGLLIAYISLDVINHPGGRCVGTEQRLEIIRTLDEAEKLLERAAYLIKKEGNEERFRKTLDISQQAAGMKSLLEQDWSGRNDSNGHERGST
jgi:hypothetical protein